MDLGVVGSLTTWHGWAWQGWSALVAVGTIGLATVTYRLVRTTQRSVDTAAAQIGFERRRAESAQWPRLFPAPSASWIAGDEVYSHDANSEVLPVTNGGTGVALNVSGELDFRNQEGGGPVVPFVTTSIAPLGSADIRLDWPPPPREPETPPPSGPGFWAGFESNFVSDWRNVRGKLTYEDITGGRWITRFEIHVEGTNDFRRVRVQETELARRGDGTVLSPPDSFRPDAWFTPDPIEPQLGTLDALRAALRRRPHSS